ncbi:MAG: hypothetical protein E7020_00545 [Alphaproteobacteria bacterium]|nr:hypothetical protein [Alphaproteobacteria bacterium]
MRKLSLYTIFLYSLLIFQVLASDERFTVEIKVDVSDASASIARDKAMNSATRAAVTAVAKRISTSDGAKRISEMTDAQLINFVKETSVLNEKNSDVRYMADLKIIINEELLKQYMQEREIPLLAKNNTSILIIPIFREFADDTPMLWEADNPWKNAWDNSTLSSAIKFIPISNSANNMSIINAEKAAIVDINSLENIANANQTTDVYVLDAAYNGIEGLTIIATSLSGEKFEINVNGTKSSGAELFNQAVIEARNHVEQRVLTSKANEETQENELIILYPFSSLGQWIKAEQKIKSIPEITSMEVQAMAPGKSQFKLSHTNSFENIQRSLRAQGYILENGGNYMILKNIGE